ncbi:hypothetical protein U1Q18_011094 [Sarracenia purpurea var. burkii]
MKPNNNPSYWLGDRQLMGWETTAREGNGRGTASFGSDQDEEDDETGVDDQKDGYDDDEDGEDGDDGGHEKMMWERDGLGNKSIPTSLANVASLYVSVTSSLVGVKSRSGISVSALVLILVFDLVLL